MKRMIMVLHDSDGYVQDPKEISLEYGLDDIIYVGSYDNQYKCVSKEEDEDSIVHYFKQGKTTYTFDY
jgi:hypothetical protein